MSKRQRAVPEEVTGPDMDQEDVPETRRTRSGRKVRTPAALLDSEVPVRTPTRRTRRSVLQELPAVEEKNTEEPAPELETVVEEKLGMSAEPEPVTASEPAELSTEAAAGARTLSEGGNRGEDAPVPGPAPAETAPTQKTEPVPKKKPRPGAAGTQNSAVPLGKPKSGRVWKDRNKQR